MFVLHNVTAIESQLNICLASSEFAPLAKTGGLADVNAALSAQLVKAGHDVRVLMPAYSDLKTDGCSIEPVTGLQDLQLAIGGWRFSYSIDVLTLPSGQLVHLLRCPAMFDRPGLYSQDTDEHLRFLVLSRAAIEWCQHTGFAPHIFHCHDWHTAMIPLYLKTVYAWDRLFENTRSVLTIHNIGYQGRFSRDILPDVDLGDAAHSLHQDDLERGEINFLKTGLLYADLLTTVSPTYAQEIQTDTYGMGLQDILQSRAGNLVGILNGVDYHEWNPETDPLIPANFSADDLSGKASCKLELMREMGLKPDPRLPLAGIVTRLVSQKGIDLMEQVLPRMLSGQRFGLAVLGSGEAKYERFFDELRRMFPDRVGFYRGYSNKLAHWIEAGSDMFLMPSAYEPCGLNQMYSLRYGTIPIVRATGGLADSVDMIDPELAEGTGILFEHYDANGLRWAVNTALDWYDNDLLWRQIMLNGMAQDFSWEHQTDEYVSLFRRLADL
ncbi:MAG: glycogen synthase [Pseudomonadota bacterium]